MKRPIALLFVALAPLLASGCLAGAAIGVAGSAVGAAVKVTGAVVETGVDVVTPDGDDEDDDRR